MTSLTKSPQIGHQDSLLSGVDFPPLERLILDVGGVASSPDADAERVVFLVTKNHPERLRVTLPAIAASADRLHVIDSSAGSETREICAGLNSPHVWYHGPEEQRRVLSERDTFRRALRSGFITLLSDDCWDIWSKRNYALLYARMCGFPRILMIDDDVVPPPGLVGESLGLAGDHKIVGARVRGMPDVSVVGHLCALHGFTSQSFVSGHFLAVDVAAASRFYFEDFYNEDWLFVLLNSVSTPAARHGTIFQLYWNPYVGSEQRSASEEFGETIIEGVARALLAGEGLEPLGQLAHWGDVVTRRRRTLDAVAASRLVATMPACLAIMGSVKKAASAVTAERCLDFWQTYQARLPEWRALVESAGSEGALR